MKPEDERWLDLVSQTYSLDRDLVRRLTEEFQAWNGQTVNEYVIARHQRGQAAGQTNEQIYRDIQQGLGSRRFRVSPLSVRQIRRMIYG